MRAYFELVLLLLPGLMLFGCDGKTGTKPESPARVDRLPVETELAQVTLTEKALERLGIVTAPVTLENVERRRTFGGEVAVPAGRLIVVSAPVAGTVAESDGVPLPAPGHTTMAGDPVLMLLPLLSPERYVPSPAEVVQMANARATLVAAQTLAIGDVDRGKAEVEAAQIALNRAEKLLADMAGSEREFDDARAQLNIAESNLRAAEQRAQQLARLVAQLDAGQSGKGAMPLSIPAPQSGIVLNVAVTRGQTVTAGAPLFEVADTRTMWLRVPMYVDLVPEIDTQSEARIVGLDGRLELRTAPRDTSQAERPAFRVARFVSAPPSGDPVNATVDLFFEADNRDGFLRPGQRVGVNLRLAGEQQGLVVPAKAILYDIHGGTWVYVQAGERVYRRQRVMIRFTAGDRSVLEAGPAAATPVVVEGAAELFGTEFGAGK